MKIIVYSAANQHVSAFVVNNRKTRLTWISKIHDSGTAAMHDTFLGLFGLHALRELWCFLQHLETIRVLISILIAEFFFETVHQPSVGIIYTFAPISWILKLIQ